MFTFFLPAVGTRELIAGSLASQGSGGYYWSSTQAGSGAGYMPFFSASVSNPSYFASMGYGESIRCVRYEIKRSDESATKVVVVFLACLCAFCSSLDYRQTYCASRSIGHGFEWVELKPVVRSLEPYTTRTQSRIQA